MIEATAAQTRLILGLILQGPTYVQIGAEPGIIARATGGGRIRRVRAVAYRMPWWINTQPVSHCADHAGARSVL